MTSRFYFENINASGKSALENYFQEKKMIRLEKLLQHGNFELAKFTANAKYHSRHALFVVRLGLNFAKHNLAAQDQGHALLEAFDLAFDRIVSQLRKVESRKHE